MPMTLIPIQAAAPPYVGVRDKHGDDEGNHLDEAERPQLVEGHRPGVKEDDLDVEDDEQHRGQVVLDRDLATAKRNRGWLDAAFVRFELRLVPALGTHQGSRDD